MDHIYYPDMADAYWNIELQTILAYCFGKGIDIGSGGRTPLKDQIKVDVDPKKNPDILASGEAIPVKDSEFDYLTAIHNLEHYDDQDAVLKEWVRIVKNKGYILIIHPNLDYTKIQLPPELNESLKNDPYNKHFHERNLVDFTKWIKSKQRSGFEFLESGDALRKWSFYCILRVKK